MSIKLPDDFISVQQLIEQLTEYGKMYGYHCPVLVGVQGMRGSGSIEKLIPKTSTNYFNDNFHHKRIIMIETNLDERN